jgi:hypothetical protein
MEAPRRQNHYTVNQRREALERIAVDGCKPTARALNIPLGTLKGWRKGAKKLFEFKGAQTSRTTKGQGAKSKITFGHYLITFMKDVRREEEVRQFVFYCIFLHNLTNETVFVYWRHDRVHENGTGSLA